MPKPGSNFQSKDAYYSQIRKQISASFVSTTKHSKTSENSCQPYEPSLPLASVVVLNFNGEDIIKQCLRHLYDQSYQKMEIIVVDNASSDNSLSILHSYSEVDKIILVESGKNLGVAGGRNLGAAKAKGDVIAFIDNDGYADPSWLENAISTLLSESDIGAVASLVFFKRRRIILNGAGGTINLRGYGGDHCFNAPYETAALPNEVLYPMGCGMVLRRSAYEAVGVLDELLFNYYDDVEIGIRIWRSGFRIVLSRDAWVDHDFSYSDRFNKNKVYLCERNRIRNAIKYLPPKRLPRWLIHEFRIFRYLFFPGTRTLPFKAWGWNVRHLYSALRIRQRYANPADGELIQIYPSWDRIPSNPDSQSFSPTHENLKKHIYVGARESEIYLNFGWHHTQQDEYGGFRWTGNTASVYIRAESGNQDLCIIFRGQGFDQKVTFEIRHLGKTSSIWSFTENAPFGWTTRVFNLNLPEADYEFLIIAEPTIGRKCRRRIGIAVREIGFKLRSSSLAL